MTTPSGPPGDILTTVGRHHSRTGALALAATEVVVRRMHLGGAAMVDPASADHAEFARMVPEKARAFAAAGAALVDQATRIGQTLAGFAVEEATRAAAVAADMLASRTPAGMAAAQADAVRGWLGQWVARSGALVRLTLDAQAAMMAPLHQVATANVERLRG